MSVFSDLRHWLGAKLYGNAPQRIGGNAGPENFLRGIFPSALGPLPLVNTRALLETYDTTPWSRACAEKVGIAIGTGMCSARLFAVGKPEDLATQDPDAPVEEGLITEEWKKKAMAEAMAEAFARRLRRLKGQLEPWAEGTTRVKELQRSHGADRWKRMDALKRQRLLHEIVDHPFYDAIQDPNPYMTCPTLFKVTEVALDLVGDAFWLLERNNAGVPIHFWPIPPHWVIWTPTPDRPTFRVSWLAWQRNIPEAEIIWFHEPAPLHPYERGSGIGWAIGDEIEVDTYLSKLAKQLFFNHARPDWIFAVPESSQAEAKRLEMDIMHRFQGFWRWFKPFFFAGGSPDFKISERIHEFQRPTMEQLVYPGLRKSQRDIIFQTWGIPLEMFGYSEHGALAQANYEGAEYIFAKWVTLPRGERLRAILQQKLMPLYDSRLLLDFPNPVADDKQFSLSVMKAMPAAFSFDEWRDRGGFPPLPNDQGKVHLVPLNSYTTEDLDAPPPAPAAGAKPPGDSEPPEVEPPGNGNGHGKRTVVQSMTLMRLSEEAGELKSAEGKAQP